MNWDSKWGEQYPSGEGPEERMYREAHEQALKEEQQREFDADEAERLIASLKPEHSTMRVISLADLIKYELPHRAYPI